MAAAAADGAADVSTSSGSRPWRADDRGDRRDAPALAGTRGAATPLDVAAEFVALTLRIVGRALLASTSGARPTRSGRP